MLQREEEQVVSRGEGCCSNHRKQWRLGPRWGEEGRTEGSESQYGAKEEETSQRFRKRRDAGGGSQVSALRNQVVSNVFLRRGNTGGRTGGPD
jgi:hypothetical protein